MSEPTEAAKEKWHYLMEHALGAEHIRNMLIERDAKIEGLEGTIDDLRESLETHFVAGEVLKKGSVEIERLKQTLVKKEAEIQRLFNLRCEDNQFSEEVQQENRDLDFKIERLKQQLAEATNPDGGGD